MVTIVTKHSILDDCVSPGYAFFPILNARMQEQAVIYPANIYMLELNKRKTKKRCSIYSKLSVRWIWLYVIVVSRTGFRANSNSIVASLAKWLSVRLRNKWFWVRVQLQSLNLHISRLLQARGSLTFRQL